MRFVSLFSGIGGIDLGLERAGMECVAQVEWDDWCTRVLEKHWPDVPRWKDIHDVDPMDLPDHDLIAGGFPCQPVSNAGRRAAQDDERWLWPEFFRIVRVVRPAYVLVENVPGLASVNDGAAMGEVLGALASIGYDAEWQSIPAAAVGAPHLRWRIFIVAYPQERVPDPEVWNRRQRERQQHAEPGAAVARVDGPQQPLADADGITHGRLHGGRQDEAAETLPTGGGEAAVLADAPGSRRRSATGSAEPGGGAEALESGQAGAGRRGGDVADTDDRRPHDEGAQRPSVWGPGSIGPRGRRLRPDPDWWEVEPDVGRVVDGFPGRVDRLRGLGNAVVPHVASAVGLAIMEREHGRVFLV